jgi:hypothetical protein
MISTFNAVVDLAEKRFRLIAKKTQAEAEEEVEDLCMNT